jgi:5'-nucleotidase
LSIIQLDIQDKIEVRLIEKVKIDSKILPNEQIQKMVSVYLENTSKMLDQEIGYINTPLDGRYTVVRTRETNLGNFMSDIVLTGVVADCCLLNAGSLRSDRIHPVGPFTLKDLRDILSFESELVVLSVTGIFFFHI